MVVFLTYLVDMSEKRFFHVESKSFEIVKNAIELSIIERGRKHMSIVSMGFAAAFWLRDALVEITKVPTEQNLFRSFREGNKVFVLQKQRNGRGWFVTITVLGDVKGRGCVIVPEGRDAWGWQGMSHEINGIMAVTPEKVHRRLEPTQGNKVSNFGKDSRTFKDAIIHGGDLPEISLEISGNQGDLHTECNGLGADTVELSLKIILANGPNGKWGVKWAGVNLVEIGSHPPQAHRNEEKLEHSNLNQVRPTQPQPKVQPTQPKPKPKPKPKFHFTAPKPKMVWAPRVRGLKHSDKANEASTSSPPADFTPDIHHDHVSLHSWESESQLSLSSVGPDPSPDCMPLDEILKGVGMVDRSWGTPQDWFLELRDGRRLRIPVDIRTPVADGCLTEDVLTQKLIQWASSQRALLDSGDEDDDSDWGSLGMDYGSEDTGMVSELEGVTDCVGLGHDLALVTTNGGEMSGSDQIEDENGALVVDGEAVEGQKDAEPLSVEPLAVAFPSGAETAGNKVGKDNGRKASDWVLRRQKAIGKLLGANYEGYEQAVEKLLLDIEARHIQRKANMVGSRKTSSSGRKGCRELKGLVSSINYQGRDIREGKGKEKVQGGAVVVYQ